MKDEDTLNQMFDEMNCEERYDALRDPDGPFYDPFADASTEEDIMAVINQPGGPWA